MKTSIESNVERVRKACQSLGSQGIMAFLDGETKAAFLKVMEKGEMSKEGGLAWRLCCAPGKALAVRDGRSWGATGQASRALLQPPF